MVRTHQLLLDLQDFAWCHNNFKFQSNSNLATSKFTSPQQLHAKQGPSSFIIVSLLGPWMENLG